MNRIGWKLCIVMLLGLLAPVEGPSTAAGAAEASPGSGAQARPNVLVILTDDQRADSMWMMPRTRKWFGAQGTELPNAFVSTPLCCPSRASIMTGRYVHNHNVRDNYSATALDQNSTLQRYLRQAGYYTAIAGKYLNGWPLGVDPPFFHRWAIQNQGYVGARFNVDGKVRTVRTYATDYIRGRAVKFLRSFERKDARPWMLFLNPFAPHEPFTPASRHAGVNIPPWIPGPAVDEADRTDKPAVVQGRYQAVDVAAYQREQQLRSLIAVDQMVNELMRRLQRFRESKSTLAFFLSDNGFFWSEHGLYDKRFPYTEAIDVPMFVRWPGHVAAGGSDPRLTSTVDVVPTVLEAAGVPPNPAYPIDGRSLFAPGTRSRVLIEHYVDPLDPLVPVWASLRTATYQYVEYYDETGQIDEREYYDLVVDPYQLTNLLGDDTKANDPSPGQIAALSAQLSLDRRCVGTAEPTACP